MHARFIGSQGRYISFIRDVQLVLGETLATASKQISFGGDLSSLVECVRYLLIRTSIGSLAASYPAEVIVHALANEVWDAERAISTALSISDPDLRALACVALRESAELNQRQQRTLEDLVIEIAFSPEDTDLIYHTERFVALRRLLLLFPDDRKYQLTKRAASLVLTLPDVDSLDKSPKALAIAAIAPLIPFEQRERYLTIAFDSASQLSTQYGGLSRIEAFEAIFAQATGELVHRSIDAIFSIESDLNKLPLIRAIAPQMQGAVLVDVLQRVKRMEYLKYRIFGISALIPQFASAEREKLLEESWETAISKAYDDEQRALMLAALVPYRQQIQKEHDLAMIHALVPSIAREDERAKTLIVLANSSSGLQRATLVREALDSVLHLTDVSDRTKLIQSMIHLVDAEMVQRVLSVFLEIHDELSLLKS